MSKLYFAKIDVLKIDKAKLFTGKEGTYLDVTIWINDEPDKYDNTMSIQQSTKKDEDKIYLGNGKEYKKEAPKPNDGTTLKPNGGQDSGQGGGQVNTGLDEDQDIPF